jgi:cytochrome c peroxidase
MKTQEQLDVPSLLSVSSTPPYLHDGRARSLRAVITDQNPDNLHGDTRGLSEAEQNDLLTFLKSL